MATFSCVSFEFYRVWFDTGNAFGYFIAMIPQVACTNNYVLTVAVICTLFFGVLAYVKSFICDLTTMLPSSDDSVSGEKKKHTFNRQDMRKCVKDSIKLHSEVLK